MSEVRPGFPDCSFLNGSLWSPQETGLKRRSKCTIQSNIGNLGRDPEQREARANGVPFTVLSVATVRSWKNSQGEWESRTDWHRVVCFQRMGESALALHKGDQVFVTGSLVSSKYDRQVGSGKKATTLKLTSWQIRANVLRKLNRAAKEPEAVASGSQPAADDIPF